MPQPGTMFQIVPEGGNHFWIVISQPKNGKILAVNLTDEENCPHSPCKIDVNEHPSVTLKSAVNYRKTREFPADKVDEQLQIPSLVRQLEDCSQEILKRVIEGAKKSDELTLKFLEYL